MVDAHRDRRRSPVATWTAVAIALAIHVALAATFHSVGTALALGHQPRSPVAADLQTACVTDAVLALSARTTMCFAPWQSDRGACLDDAQKSARADLASCPHERDSSVAEVAVIDPSAMERMRSIDPTPLLAAAPDRALPEAKPPDAAPPEKVPPPQPTRPSQVVETAKPDEEKAPDNARFLAEYDTSVAKQTVARGAVDEPMVAKSKPSVLTPKSSPKDIAATGRGDNSASASEPQLGSGTGTGRASDSGALAMRPPSQSVQEARERGSSTGASGRVGDDGYLPKKGQGDMALGGRDARELAPGQRGTPGAPTAPNLKPSSDVLERAIGGGNVDHLEGVEAGDETALSAKRWVHASFFNRLKRQVAQNWDPASVWRRSDPRGQVYGAKTRVTEVRVSLSPSGRLAKIVVTTPSGVGDLDDEALRAFRAAGPFPNPPKDLAGPDQLITFAFAFYFEIGAPRSSWRVIRSL